MKLRKNVYYYLADIRRNGVTKSRQGTIHAETPFDAIDEVRKMADKVWRRTVAKITITHPHTCAILATSVVGVGNHQPPITPLIDDDYDDNPMGWINKPSTAWYPATFGTYFRPNAFGRLIAFK